MQTITPVAIDRLPDSLAATVQCDETIMYQEQKALQVTVTRCDGDGVLIPHTEATMTWSAGTDSLSVRIPGHAECLGETAIANRLEMTYEQAWRLEQAIATRLREAWRQMPASDRIDAQASGAWLCIHEATGDMVAADTGGIAAALEPWCSPDQQPELQDLQRSVRQHSPSIMLQRRLGIRLVAVHPTE